MNFTNGCIGNVCLINDENLKKPLVAVSTSSGQMTFWVGHVTMFIRDTSFNFSNVTLAGTFVEYLQGASEQIIPHILLWLFGSRYLVVECLLFNQ